MDWLPQFRGGGKGKPPKGTPGGPGPGPVPVPPPVSSPAYYVRTDGNNANLGTTNSAGGAWRTIQFAINNVPPGSIIRVQAGTYAERVTPNVSGTAGNTITLVADGAATFCGMDISNKNYLRIIGFTIDSDAGACTFASRAISASGTNTGIEFWHNTIRNAGAGISHGAYAYRHHNWVVIGNRFEALGSGGVGISIRGNHNILAYNEITSCDPDSFVIDGTNCRWMNNYLHDNPVTAPAHGDAFQSNASSLGLSFNLFESNVVIGLGNLPHEHGALIQNQSTVSCSTGVCAAVTENLFRRNVWHNISSVAISVDQAVVAPITETRQVHDTVVQLMRQGPSVPYASIFNYAGITARVHNSLNYEAWGTGVSTGIQVYGTFAGASISSAGYNLAFDPNGPVTFAAPWTAQSNPRSNVDPVLTNVGADDFTIGSSSGARGTAGPLTTASGSGTGTTFNVAAGGGGFFRGQNTNIDQYGQKLAAGDVITVGTDVVTVVSISGDAITVTPSFTWANGDPVYLGSSTTPDIGALPYKAGGYSLSASYSSVGGTVTVTPSDADLVRFVVCFVDGVPQSVANASPFVCSVTSGALTVRVYPRYPSFTLWANATP